MTHHSLVSFDHQISEVECEIRVRYQSYPGLVAAGKMGKSEADERIRRMEAVRSSLRWMADNRDVVRKAMK